MQCWILPRSMPPNAPLLRLPDLNTSTTSWMKWSRYMGKTDFRKNSRRRELIAISGLTESMRVQMRSTDCCLWTASLKALKGELDLVNPAWAVQKELMTMPVKSDDAGHWSNEITAILNFKKMMLLVAGAAV